MPETFYQWQFLGHQMDTLFGLLESQKLKKDILKINTSLAALGALAHRLNAAPPATPNRPLNPKWPTGSGKRLNLRLFDPMRASKIQNGRQGVPKWPIGFLGAPVNFL